LAVNDPLHHNTAVGASILSNQLQGVGERLLDNLSTNLCVIRYADREGEGAQTEGVSRNTDREGVSNQLQGVGQRLLDNLSTNLCSVMTGQAGQRQRG
jgi:hypothetical protein